MFTGSLFTLAEFCITPVLFSVLGENFMDKYLPIIASYKIQYHKPVNFDIFV